MCLLSLASHPCPIWTFTWGIRSWGPFRGWLSSMRSDEVVGKYFQSFPHELAWFPPSDILVGIRSCCWVWYPRGSPLRSRCRVFDRPTARLEALLPGFWSSLSSPWFLGFSKVLGRNAPQLRATSWEVWLLPSFILVSRLRRFCQAASLLSDGIFSVAVFPHVLWGGEYKIEVI